MHNSTPDTLLLNMTTYEDTSFFSQDSLKIHADIFIPENYKEFILLCHQANSSRGEYTETTEILAQNRFASIAIDQRSGDKMNGIKNKTAKMAIEQGKSTGYMDALADIRAGIDFTYKLNQNRPIVCFGSSYSASLVLLLSKNNEKVKAVCCFSPGEYLKGVTLHDSLTGFDKPIFITCAKNEIEQTGNLLDSIPEDELIFFKPDFEGNHGSSALWESTSNNQKYWERLLLFLEIL